MKDLFSTESQTPLADQLRPQNLQDVLGQDHILGPEGPIGVMLEKKSLNSFILWGPAGCGKTTIARLIAKTMDADYMAFSAVFSGVKDLREGFQKARQAKSLGRQTIVFIDEIHRFNKSQQDSLLPVIEDGTIICIGATTENPSFELNAALLSRCQVFVLNALRAEDLKSLIKRAEDILSQPLALEPKAKETLIDFADGDGRYLLNLVELLHAHGSADKPLTLQQMQAFLQKRAPLYDKSGEGHYNLISALHKSLRGSDVQAGLYWFCRMLEGGEDPRYIARRLIRFATEDIGMADPQAIVQAETGLRVYERLGSPEGELAIAQVVIYLATAPKSNSIYSAFSAAQKFAKQYSSLTPPKHILNAPTSLMKSIGYGKDYAYDHNEEDGFSGQNYFPENVKRQEFYQPKPYGFEKDIQKRLDYWQKLRLKKQKDAS